MSISKTFIFFVTVLLLALNPARAQRLTAANPAVVMEEDWQILVRAITAVPPFLPPARTAAPMSGTFYSAQLGEQLPPAPANFLNLPLWDLGDGFYLLDDRRVDYFPRRNGERSSDGEMSYATASSATVPPALGGGEGGMSGGANAFPSAFNYTNGLWLEVLSVDVNWITLRLHGTVADSFYEILSKTNLNETGWRVEQGLLGLADLTPVPPLALAPYTQRFFRARNVTLDTDGDRLGGLV